MKKSYSLTHFEHLLPIMNLKAKGYWRVQSLELLERKLKKNENSYAIQKLKNKISRVSRALPDYFKIIKCPKAKKLPNIHLIKTKKKDDLFITTQHPKRNTEPDQEKKEVVEKLFRNFPQERTIYNELEFFSTNAKKRFSPRTFNEVIEDSRKMVQFEAYMKNVKKSFSTFGNKPMSYQSNKEEKTLFKEQKDNQNICYTKNYPTLIGNPKNSRNNITQPSFHNKIINTASLKTKRAVQSKLRKLGYYY